MGRGLAVVLASGGMDSCVTVAHANLEFDLALLHVNYGQRTEDRELKSFRDIAAFYNVARTLVVSLPHLGEIGGSSLTDPAVQVEKANLGNKDIPASYVPFRNANMLAAGVSWGEGLGAKAIFVGAVEEDSSGYPDCRREFFDAYEGAIRAGTKPSTRLPIITPIIHLSKSEIVLKGLSLGAPLHLTWSCYQSEDQACGVCDSCALRLRGFQRAGVEDPIAYRHRPNYVNA